MEKIKWIALAMFVSGLSILLIPDHGKPVLFLNEKHGPSAIDLPGLILLMFAWLLTCFIIIKSWKKIQEIMGKHIVTFLLAVYFISISGIIYSLIYSNDNLLWIFASSAALVNTIFIILSFMKRSIL